MFDLSRRINATPSTAKTTAVIGAGPVGLWALCGQVCGRSRRPVLIGATLDLAELRETEPNIETIWTLRSDNPEKSFGGGTNDKLGRLFAQLVRSGSVRVGKGFCRLLRRSCS